MDPMGSGYLEERVIRYFIVFWGLIAFQGCTNEPETGLQIATAANVQFAMKELTEAFTNETTIPCDIIIGSSGKLTAQIKEGAPYDVFVSANMKYPKDLHENGFTKGAPEVYASGKLVMWTMNKDFPLELDFLKNDKIKHIAIANPQHAPYGIAAKEVLVYGKIYQEVTDKLVYGESISQVNQFILSETADVGFTAYAVILSPKLRGQGYWAEVSSDHYSPIQQGIALIKKEGKNTQDAQRFYEFMFSEKAQEILEEYGYGVGSLKSEVRSLKSEV